MGLRDASEQAAKSVDAEAIYNGEVSSIGGTKSINKPLLSAERISPLGLLLSACACASTQFGPWNPACFRVFNEMRKGSWVGDIYAPGNSTGRVRFVPPASCALQSDAAVRNGTEIAAVRRGLAGKKLFFAGDMTMLFFVKALLYALHGGTWSAEWRFSARHSPFSHDFDGWGMHFARLTHDLGPENFRCDCFQ